LDNLEIADIDIIMDPSQSGELIALLAEFKLSINDYLEELINSTVKSLSDIIAFNLNNSVLVSS
jgi:amidase